jgi:tetratricopeptide (TPR) repeat protein
MLENLRRHWRYYEYECRSARSGSSLSAIEMQLGDSTEEAPPANGELAACNARWPPAVEAQTALEEGRFDEAVGLFEYITTGLTQDDNPNADLSSHLCLWRRAYFQLQLGHCHRHAGALPAAAKATQGALRLFPRYKSALLELGLCYLDMGDGHYADAIAYFEKVISIDRAFEGVESWLTRAHAHLRREQLDARLAKWKYKVRGGSVSILAVFLLSCSICLA